MLVRHFSTNDSGNSYLGNVLEVPRRSEITKVFDQAINPWPEFTSCENTFSEKANILCLDFTETADGLVIEVVLSGIGPEGVNVSFKNESLILEACHSEDQQKSYYLGDYSQPAFRWTIPAGIELERYKVETLFVDDSVIITVMKPERSA